MKRAFGEALCERVRETQSSSEALGFHSRALSCLMKKCLLLLSVEFLTPSGGKRGSLHVFLLPMHVFRCLSLGLGIGFYLLLLFRRRRRHFFSSTSLLIHIHSTFTGASLRERKEGRKEATLWVALWAKKWGLLLLGRRRIEPPMVYWWNVPTNLIIHPFTPLLL